MTQGDANRGDPRPGHQPGLDGLRGLAVLAVLAYHLDLPFAPRGGAIGVTLFFALSGYLITTLLLREVDAGGRPLLGHFYARRALRLFPALLLVVGVVAVYAARFGPAATADQTLGGLPYVVFYVGNWYRAVTGFGSLGLLEHTWSLSVEEQFYLLWPPVVAGIVVLARDGRRWLLGVALAGSVAPLLIRLALWQGSTISGARVYNGTDTAADPLMMGCALALLLALTGGSGRLGRWLRWACWPATLLLVADALLRLGGHSGGAVTFDLLWGPTVFGLAAAVVVGATVLRPAALLRWAPLRQVGVISYGLYLWHYPVYRAVRDQQLPVATARGLVVLLSFALAATSYVVLERPLLRLKRLVPPARRPVPVAPEQETAPMVVST